MRSDASTVYQMILEWTDYALAIPVRTMKNLAQRRIISHLRRISPLLFLYRL